MLSLKKRFVATIRDKNVKCFRIKSHFGLPYQAKRSIQQITEVLNLLPTLRLLTNLKYIIAD
jgi:hypothetical protein